MIKPTRYQHFEKIQLLTFIIHLFLGQITSLKDLMVSTSHKGLPYSEFWVPKLQFGIQIMLKHGFTGRILPKNSCNIPKLRIVVFFLVIF